MTSTRRHAAPILLLVGVLVAACGGPRPAPGPGTTSGLAPDLRGRRVMILPIQQILGVRGDPDAELAFGLRGRDTSVEWILPSDLEEVLGRSPGVRTSMTGLPVGQFLTAEVRRIGDPLFGELRRLSALVDADGVVLPVQAALVGAEGADPTVRLWTALIEPRTGQVLWFSVLDGGAFPAGDPRGLASAMDELARNMLWYAGE